MGVTSHDLAMYLACGGEEQSIDIFGLNNCELKGEGGGLDWIVTDFPRQWVQIGSVGLRLLRLRGTMRKRLSSPSAFDLSCVILGG